MNQRLLKAKGSTFVRSVFAQMTKLVAIVGLGFFVLPSANAQTILLDEDFSTVTDSVIPPTGWANLDLNSSGQVWRFDNPGSRTLNSPISSPAAIFDSDQYGSAGGAEDAALETPAFDASTGSIILTFDHYFQSGFGGAYAVEVFDGTNWNIVLSGGASSTNNPQAETIDITNAANGATNAKVRFHWTGNYSWYWIVDNVKVFSVSCGAPSNVTASNITSASVDLSWSSLGGTDWQVEYGAANFTLGAGTRVTTSSNSNFNISGLTDNTSYDVYLRSICGVSDTSIWTGPISFKTLILCPPNAICATYTSGDISSLYQATVGSTDTSSCPGMVSVTIPAGNVITGVDVVYDIVAQGGAWQSEQRSRLYSPTLNNGELMVSGPSVNSSGLAAYNRTNLSFANGAQGNVDFELHVLRTWGGSGCNTTYQYVPDGTWYVVAYYGLNPPCLAPTNLGAIVGVTSADLYWTTGGSSDWNVEYGPEGFTLGSGTQVNATNDTLSIAGLTSYTEYDFYVRDSCGVGDVSPWAGPYTFTTLIGVTCTTGNPTAVLSEEFDAQGGWTGNISSSASTNGSWILPHSGGTTSGSTGPSGAHSGSNYTYVETSGNFNDSAKLISPAIDLSSGIGSAWLSFYLHAYGAATATLDVGVSTSATGPFTSVFTSTGQIQTSSADPWVQRGADLSSYLGQTIYIQFKYSGWTTFTGDLAIDLVEVITCATCLPPSNFTSSNITSTSADLSWTAGGATNWEVEYGAPSFLPGSGTRVSATTNTNFSISGLTPNTSYDIFVRDSCAIGDVSAWFGPISITTLCSSQLSGTYTVDPGQPASATNYTSLASILAELQACGVSGAVIVNVAANSGPYTGGAELSAYPGASATNTVTFNGNGNTITTGLQPYVLRLSGVSHLTIDDFIFMNSAPTSPAYGIMLANGCQHINITNNVIDMGQGSTSTSSAGITSSGSSTSAATSGNNAQYLNISNNEIIGAYYGIRLNGNSSYADNFGNNISNNIIRDFYMYGIYLLNADTTTVEGNDIHRMNRTSVSTFYGIYLSTSRNIKVLKNQIHDSNTGAGGANSCYPIYLTTSVNSVGYETEFINNAIYNINPTSSIIYGMYHLNTRSNVKMYHNTVDIDLLSGSSGTTRAFFSSGAATNYDIKNNIFSVRGPGTGTKYSIYISVSTSTGFSSDNNVLHMGSTTGTNHVGYWGTTQSTLSDWQTASSGDANSVNSDPLLNVITPISGVVNNIGTPVGVTEDIFGSPRSGSTPDPGAVEFTAVSSDLALVSGAFVKNGLCLSSNDTAEFVVENVIGGTLDFSTDPLTLNWSATGPVNSSGSVVINTGTLAANASLTIVVTGIDLSQNGTYDLDAYISPNTHNLFTGNDTLSSIQISVSAPVFSVTPSNTVISNSNETVVLTASSPFLFAAGPLDLGNASNNGSGGNFFDVTIHTDMTLDGFDVVQTGASANYRIYYKTGVYNQFTTDSTAWTFLGAYTISGNGLNAYTNITLNTPLPLTSGNYAFHIISTNGGHRYNNGVSVGDVWATNGAITVYEGLGTGNTPFPTSTFSPRNFVGKINYTLPPNPVPGLTWTLNGVVIDSLLQITVGPYSLPGTFQYVAAYNSPCGMQYDTATVVSNVTSIACNAMLTSTTNDTLCQPGAASLVATSNAQTVWFNDTLSITTVNDTLNLASVSSSTYYKVGAYQSTGTSVRVGPLATLTPGGYGNFINGQFITVLDTIRIDSLTLNANGQVGGNIAIRPATGATPNANPILQLSKPFLVQSGITQVEVGLILTPGNYFMNVVFNGAQTTGQLYRTTGGAVYPYTAPGLLSITGTDFGTQNRIYYTFDLVVSPGCLSNLDSAEVVVLPGPNAGSDAFSAVCDDITSYDLSDLLSASADAGGSWLDPATTGALTGSNVNTTLLTAGQYNFYYVVAAGAGCPDDTALFTLDVQACLSCNAAPPTVVNDSLCSTGLFTLLGSVVDGDIAWLQNNEIVGNGPTFSDSASAAVTYQAVNVFTTGPTAKVGPAAGSMIGGYGNFTNGQYITVHDTIRIDSTTFDANGAVSGFVQIWDVTGTNLLQLSRQWSVSGAGLHQVELGIVLYPGSYYINVGQYSGSGELFRSTEGASYPYIAHDFLTIDSVQFTNQTRYYYLFDLVVSKVCMSTSVNADVVFTTPKTAGMSLSGLPVDTVCDTLMVNLNDFITGQDGGGMWMDDDGTGAVTGSMFTTANVPANATYSFTYKVEGPGNCPSDSVTITLFVKDCSIGLDEYGLEMFTLYPNPNTGVFTITNNWTGGRAQIEISDITGKTIFRKDVNTSEPQIIDLRHVAAGVYMVKVTSGERVQVRKVSIH